MYGSEVKKFVHKKTKKHQLKIEEKKSRNLKKSLKIKKVVN
jgi:hypothetical protein